MTLHPLTPHDRYRPARSQMSHHNVFPPPSGRGRSRSAARRAHVWAADPCRRRDEFLRRWSRLMLASFASPEACAMWADATTQTARNWMDGTHRPCGDVVALAALTLPGFSAVMGNAA